MSWLAQAHVTTGTLITAAYINQNVDNDTYVGQSHDHFTAIGSGDGGNIPAISCLVKNSGNQTLNTAVTTSLTFDTDEDDPKAMHSVASNTERIVAVKAGRYLYFGRVQIQGSAAGTLRSLYLVDDVGGIVDLHQVSAFSAATYATLLVCRILNKALNGYAYLQARQDSGGDLVANFGATYFGATFLGS